ncbi:MAG: hypothetical protein DCC67_19935 [Planctomycetota bacterium]|nr:MAG: hypothetical protein DCC67_19935 [Planctomycetota bacterium]
MPRSPRLAALAAIIAAAATIWLFILPLAARAPSIERHIRRNESLGVDPSAKFYSELPAMPRLWQRIKHAQRLRPVQREENARQETRRREPRAI